MSKKNLKVNCCNKSGQYYCNGQCLPKTSPCNGACLDDYRMCSDGHCHAHSQPCVDGGGNTYTWMNYTAGTFTWDIERRDSQVEITLTLNLSSKPVTTLAGDLKLFEILAMEKAVQIYYLFV